MNLLALLPVVAGRLLVQCAHYSLARPLHPVEATSKSQLRAATRHAFGYTVAALLSCTGVMADDRGFRLVTGRQWRDVDSQLVACAQIVLRAFCVDITTR